MAGRVSWTWAICVSLLLNLLVTACGLYSASLVLILPQVIGFPENLRRALDEIIGFQWLELDAAQVQLAASEALQSCGVDSHQHCWQGRKAAVQPGAWNWPAHQAIAEAFFARSLPQIQRFSNDSFFGVDALRPVAARLSFLTESVQATKTSALCTTATPFYCEAFLEATALSVEAPETRAAASDLVESLAGALRGLGGAVRIVYALHALPYISLVPVTVCAFGLCRRGKSSRCGRVCELFSHVLLWLVFFPISTAICLVGLDVKLAMGILTVDALQGGPSLAALLPHARAEFPGFWEAVLGEAPLPPLLTAELAVEAFLYAQLAIEALCVVVALRCLLCRGRGRGASAAGLTDQGEPVAADLCADITAEGAWPGAPAEELQELSRLKPCQLRALGRVRWRCRQLHLEALPRLERRARALGFSREDLAAALTWVRERAPIIVHLDLASVGALLAADSHYRNQFETSTSGGTLDEGRRRSWERGLFGDAYQDAAPFDRCKYGALNVTSDPQGVRACHQYGYSYLLLRGVRLRSTFCATDSAGMGMEHLATVDYCAHVFEKFADGELATTLQVATQRIPGADSHVLRGYKEAQIHGEIRLADHIELVMAHPSLRASGPWAEILVLLQERCKAQVVWIEGGIDRPSRPRPPPATRPPVPPRVAPAPGPSEEEVLPTVRVRLPDVPLRPGTMVQVEVPGGRLVEIAVPSDAVPGQWITVMYPRGALAVGAGTASASAGSTGSAAVGRLVGDFAAEGAAAATASTSTATCSAAAAAEEAATEEEWEVELDGGCWAKCDGETMTAIRSAQAAGSRYASFEFRGFRYEIDLEAGVQCNLMTGKRRSVRTVSRVSL